MKNFIIFVLISVIVILGGAYIFTDMGIASAMRKGFKEFVPLPVSLGSVKTQILNQRVTILGLEIKNPPEIVEGKLFKADYISAQIDLASVFKSNVVIPSIVLKNLEMALLIAPDGSTNMDELLPPKTEKPAGSASAKTFTVQELQLKQILISAQIRQDKIELAIEDMVLKDLRTDGDAKDLIQHLVRQVYTQVYARLKAEKKSIFEQTVREKAGAELERLKEKVNNGGLDKLKEDVQSRIKKLF